MADIVDHDDLANVFLGMGALQSPAELHGYAVGFIAVGGRTERSGWLKHCCDLLDIENPDPEQSDELFRVYTAAKTALASDDLALQLLLPGDELDLDQRIASLGQWVQGFLTGFAMAGKQVQKDGGSLEALSSDSREALSDLAAVGIRPGYVTPGGVVDTGRTRIAYLNPEDTGALLIELVEMKPDSKGWFES